MKLLKPYTGDKNYVFAAFSRQDERRALGIIEQLLGCGIRIWYDNGTSIRSNCPDIIDNYLEQCDAVLLFVSQNTVGSHDCRRQINSAVIKRKPVTVVFLEKTQLTPGMKLQLLSAQSVSMHKTDVEELFEILLENEFIKKCFDENDSSVNDTPNNPVNSGFSLIRRKTGERISIPLDGLRVGRRSSLCDYTIEGNKTVSRLHAVFSVRDNHCFVTDQESLNGVYINGVRLAENKRAQLTLNDEIRLGNERFVLNENV